MTKSEGLMTNDRAAGRLASLPKGRGLFFDNLRCLRKWIEPIGSSVVARRDEA